MKKKLSEEAKLKTKKVRFNLYASEAKRVFLAGDFNNWDVDNLPMKKDNKGTWEASFALPAGRYEYRFRVDEVWQDDPNAQEKVENPFGSQNCVRMMSQSWKHPQYSKGASIGHIARWEFFCPPKMRVLKS